MAVGKRRIDAVQVSTSREGRSRALRNATLGWTVITVVTAPFAYFGTLVLTLPILGCLAAVYWVEPRGFDILYCLIAALTMTVCIAWFLGRADERPMEGVIAAFLVACALAELLVLRSARRERVSRRRAAA